MATKLVELQDGILVEVEALPEQAQQISGGLADKVDATLDSIKPILVRACRPITAAWEEVSQDVRIEKAEIELGLGFEAEGNLYVTRSKASANLSVKLVLTSKGQSK